MKSPVMEKFLDDFTIKTFGVSRTEQKCPFCKTIINPDTDFRDALSRKEFEISKLCQKCQDEVFGA